MDKKCRHCENYVDNCGCIREFENLECKFEQDVSLCSYCANYIREPMSEQYDTCCICHLYGESCRAMPSCMDWLAGLFAGHEVKVSYV